MRTLIILRHGKAVREHEAPTDRARDLTERGERQALEAGARMAAAGLRPGVILASPALRTQRTAALAATAFPGAELREVESLYMADPETIWAAAAACGADEVLAVGHNPGAHELCRMLIAQAADGSALARDLAGHFPTATWAAFDLAGDVLEAAGPRLRAGGLPRDA